MFILIYPVKRLRHLESKGRLTGLSFLGVITAIRRQDSENLQDEFRTLVFPNAGHERWPLSTGESGTTQSLDMCKSWYSSTRVTQ
jgi:hypothetical protein